MKKRKKENSHFLQTLFYCVKLSFDASAFYTIFRVLYSSASALITITISYIAKLILDVLASNQNTEKSKQIAIYLIILTLLTILSEVGSKINDYSSAMHNDKLRNKVRMQLMETAAHADMEFFDSPKYYDAFESVKLDTYEIIQVVWNIIMFISYFISLCSAFIVIGKINLLFGIIVILSSLPTAYFSRKYAKQLYFWSLDNIDVERKMSYLEYIVSDKMFAMEIRLYHLGGFLQDYFFKTWATYFHNRKQLNKKRVTLNAFVSTIPPIAIFFILLSITHNILNGTGTIGDYSLYSGMLTTLSTSTLLFFGSAIEIYENKLKMDNVKNFQSYKSKIEDKGTCKLGNDISIEFRNVSFCYPDTECYVLDHVNFQIAAGEHIGLVGLNGSGKSTIIKLLLRFYDPTSGQILLNDKDIKEYPIEEIRNHFSTFFQQYVIFAFSMKDNVSMFDPNVTEEKILDALNYSDAIEVYNSLGKDLNTFLAKGFDENGVELSGGQRQKIALARAFYRKGNVVILDEPSAALDPEAEYKIFERMKELCTEKTSIFVSHRLSNIVFADKVILMEHGKVIEYGTHQELLAKKGRYAELFNYQAKQYDDLKKE